MTFVSETSLLVLNNQNEASFKHPIKSLYNSLDTSTARIYLISLSLNVSGLSVRECIDLIKTFLLRRTYNIM